MPSKVERMELWSSPKLTFRSFRVLIFFSDSTPSLVKIEPIVEYSARMKLNSGDPFLTSGSCKVRLLTILYHIKINFQRSSILGVIRHQCNFGLIKEAGNSTPVLQNHLTEAK